MNAVCSGGRSRDLGYHPADGHVPSSLLPAGCSPSFLRQTHLPIRIVLELRTVSQAPQPAGLQQALPLAGTRWKLEGAEGIDFLFPRAEAAQPAGSGLFSTGSSTDLALPISGSIDCSTLPAHWAVPPWKSKFPQGPTGSEV